MNSKQQQQKHLEPSDKANIPRSPSQDSTSSQDEHMDETAAGYEEKSAILIEDELLKAICDGNRPQVAQILHRYRPSALLQSLITFSYVNRSPMADLQHAASKMGLSSALALHSNSHQQLTISSRSSSIGSTGATAPSSTSDKSRLFLLKQQSAPIPSPTISSVHLTSTHNQQRPYFTFDADILQEVHELLGQSVSPLNFIQIACMLGDEELAADILDFVYHETVPKGQRLVLMEFLGKTWGDGNTTLHLASFQGMSDLVKKLLKYGANTSKMNGRGYRAVDCADDDSTRLLFRNIKDRRISLIDLNYCPEDALESLEVPIISVPCQSQVETSSSTNITSSSEELKDTTSLKKLSLISSMKSMETLTIASTPRRRVIWEPNALLMDYAKNGELELIKSMKREMKHSSKTTISNYTSNTELDFNCRTPHTGLTPLHMACAYGHLELIRYLIEEAKADVTLRDSDGWSILHSCIAEIPDPETFPNSVTEEDKKDRQRFIRVLKYLLSLPLIDLQAMTEDGETVFDVVKEIDDNGSLDEEILKMLEEALKNRGIKLGRTVEEEDINEDYGNETASSSSSSTTSSSKNDLNYEMKQSAVALTKTDSIPRITPSPLKTVVNTISPSSNNSSSFLNTQKLFETRRHEPLSTARK